MADVFGGEEFLNNLKNYCKVDQDFDDEIIIEMANAAAAMIAKAIDKSKTPDDYADEPRFKIAVMKQVKEDYYERGLTADSYRPEIGSGINGIINQLRSEVNTDETTEHDGTDNILLSPNGDQSGNSSTDQGSES
ncbi:MAG TPA: head-tail connector protein [Candidatus Limosilactobacillus intestinavium]|uniref:Phage gp6-like head-tail connector protein n=1 Tax=Limosilactobacillus reuteri TaxID=1598 RepID=A0AAW9ZE01_LIMRT|nr:head-tail connector protein [Limosilactobacillus reuteri]NME21169.1 phage gp6-like head-tail connector protein [Limosilactobacillus reuteri]HJA22606.1 head-tail connector protein [Candidatus Limosilactobacillus intestinavium]